MKRSSILTVILSLSVIALVTELGATPITFTFKGSGSGTVGEVGFESSAFTITAVADTAARQVFSGAYFVVNTSASIDIMGVGTFDFLTGTTSFFNAPLGAVGFSRNVIGGSDLFDSQRGLLSGWDMLTSVGPVDGTFSLIQWGLSPVNTDGGVLNFSNQTVLGAFSAVVVSSVPDSGITLALLGGSVIGLAALRRRIVA